MTIVAAVLTIFTVVFLGWMWGTIAPQPPQALTNFVQDFTSATQSILEEQVEHLSQDN
ncbi:hypothetical protein [Streptomyces aurantiogriseus]|uniref:hypothetical protein n=1 Tax=Streptomyces aurantiogriseus TaxID=66870 RepID=UPI001675B3D4|nr:hypothetical protein [Streptomyces aurantiogriseus]